MKTATAKELKIELAERSPKELLEICLKLSRFKKENKELLTYLLFEAQDESTYIYGLKAHIDVQFQEINYKTFYLMKKSIRKILKDIKKYIRYSKKTETEIELLIYFCQKLRDMKPSISRSLTLINLYERQVDLIKRRVITLHEDLQFDYELELQEL